MTIIFGLIALCILLFSVVRISEGVALYLLYFFLIPFFKLDLGISLQYNFANTILLLSFLYHFKIREKIILDWKPLIPFFILYALFLLAMFFQKEIPFSYMLNKWRLSFMITLLLPIVIWNLIVLDNDNLLRFKKVLYLVIGVATVYGIILTLIPGQNPYIEVMSEMNDMEFDDRYLTPDGRLFGRISSVFLHPMTYGLFLGLSAIYLFMTRENIPPIVYSILMSLVVINMITCGVRSVIGGVVVAGLFFLISNWKLKYILYFLGSLVAARVLLSLTPDLLDYLSSIADINNSTGNVQGSSFDMRLLQLAGCFDEIGGNLLWGNGYSWHVYYLENFDEHPIILAFESLIFVTLCDSGIMGFVFWIVFVSFLVKYVSKYLGETRKIATLLVFYISYSCITGEYNYMKYFIIFFVILAGEYLVENSLQNTQENIQNEESV